MKSLFALEYQSKWALLQSHTSGGYLSLGGGGKRVLDNDSNRILTRSLFEDLYNFFSLLPIVAKFTWFFVCSLVSTSSSSSCSAFYPKFVQRTLRFSEPNLHITLFATLDYTALLYTTLLYSTLFYFILLYFYAGSFALLSREKNKERSRERGREREF